MTSRAAVERFVAERTLAIVGVSRSGKKFGNAVLKELSGKGYTLYPIHPEAASIDGHAASKTFADMPSKAGGVIVVVPPAKAEGVVRDAHAAGIDMVWLQQGAGSPDAVRFCEQHGMTVIDGECILMFTNPTAWYHRAHRWLWHVMGKLPE
jgi:predicted CoA-binding protein